MKKSMSLHKGLSVMAGVMLAFAIFVTMIVGVRLVSTQTSPFTADEVPHELVFYELSPKGRAGGYMVPASCPSGYTESGAHTWTQTSSRFLWWQGNYVREFTDTYSVPCAVAIPPPTLTLTRSPSSVVSGSAASLTWRTTNVTSCVASRDWSGNKAWNGSQSTGALYRNSTFRLRCTGPSGSIQREVSVAVTQPLPTLNFTRSPASVNIGGASTLTWSTANATSCSASGAWSGDKVVNGSQSTGPLTTTPNTYTLTCTGPGGSTGPRSVQVTIPAPTLTITANPAVVNYGGSSTITWSTINATSCSTAAHGNWTASTAPSGSQVISNIVTTPNTYTLTCTGPGGSVTRTANAATGAVPGPGVSSVTIPAPAATLEVRINGGVWTTAAQTIEPADTVDTRWSSTNATTCNADGFAAGETSGTALNVTRPNPGSTKTYSISCPGATGTSPASASVDVTMREYKPTLNASSLFVNSGSSVILTYDLNTNSQCFFRTTDSTLSNQEVNTNGTRQTGAITRQTAYTLECPGGSAALIINVEGDIREQ